MRATWVTATATSMIKLDYLSPRQIAIANVIWNCHDEADLKDTIMAMPTHRDRVDASSLVKLMMWDTVEHDIGLDEYAAATATAIACAMR